jgi:hypothetical protein
MTSGGILILRRSAEKMFSRKRSAIGARPIQQRLLAFGWDKTTRATPILWIAPPANPNLGSASDGSDGGKTAAKTDDCVCGFQHEAIIANNAISCKPKNCDFRQQRMAAKIAIMQHG